MSLHELQTTVHVSKDKRNEFGKYNYRTAEGILSAVKAALPDGASIIVTDEIQEVAGQIFVSATASVTFADGTSASATGHAMHSLQKKGMDASQITGAASSYARKYALGGLLALDDGSVDPDATTGNPDATSGNDDRKEATAAETRDRIKAAIIERKDAQSLEKLWQHPRTSEAFAKLPEPMQGELQKAYTDRMAEVYQAPASDDWPGDDA